MIPPGKGRLYLLGVFTLGLALPRAPALLNIDGSRNQLFVFGSVAFAYNSNVFSDYTNRADYTITADAGVDLKRRAGIIAVNATVKVDYVRYGKYSDENAVNPGFYIEFNKTTGRTTGAITINAFRESRADSAVNLRTSSWNFPLGLSLKYPVNDKFYVTSSTSYLQRRYPASTALANYTDYTEGLDLFYVYTSKLDLVGGYRIRVSRTSIGNNTTDHWFNVGATGGLLAKLSGSIRLGYQIRETSGSGGENFAQVNASGSLSWPVTRKLGLSGSINRDFNTIATGASVDSTGVALRATYAFTRKIEFGSGVGYGRNKFLARDQPPRTDDFFSFDVSAHYKMNEQLSLGASYTYFRNSSNISFSQFDRQGFSFDIASRY
ncbi:MAG TPA: outer membrane beta-barrel protein [Lacunisphaera sp.]|nr:outer membrane beta-barrel protein [Lacunisphaera sp.]